jgi:hypothetical protein
MPEALRCIEIGRIGWQLKHCDLSLVFGKVRPDFRLLVVGGIVLDEIHTVGAVVILRE